MLLYLYVHIYVHISGNELLNRLTNYKKQELRIDLQNWENVTAYAKYQVFKVDSEANKYRLSVSGFSGSAGYQNTHYAFIPGLN